MIGRNVLDSICPMCRFSLDATRSAIRNPPIKPWMNYRSASSYGPAFRSIHRKAPSRMVLSDRVGQPAAARRDDGEKKARPKIAGPFQGMNRTVANIDPIRRLAQSRSRPRTTGEPGTGDVKDGPKEDTREGGSQGRDRNNNNSSDRSAFKAMRMQRALTSISYGQRMKLKEQMQMFEEFNQFDLMPVIKEAMAADVLRDMTDVRPTPVQRLAIPALLGQHTGAQRRTTTRNPAAPAVKQSFLLAAETGSGKTLAYLLPSINAMKTAELADPDITAYKKRMEEEKALREDPKYKGKSVLEPHPTAARPRIVILVPTSELVDQVYAVVKKLSYMVKYMAERLSANLPAKVIERNIYHPRGLDIIISTPHLLASIAESDPNILSRVSHLIIDEADSLFDRSFSPTTLRVMDRAMPSVQQLILCSATIPKRLDEYLAKQFPDMQRIVTPNLHAIPRRVQLGVIDASREPYRNNKNLACADAIWSIGKDASRHETSVPGEVDVKRIMVFVNEREKTQEVADFLNTKGIDAVALHRDTDEQRQSEMLASFTSAVPLKTTVDRSTLVKGKRMLPNTKVIVATDIASRGIDTLAVRHVVLYDVPHTTIDFIHRLGRAGRMGRRGRGIVIVGKDDRRDIVAEVKESMFMGQALV